MELRERERERERESKKWILPLVIFTALVMGVMFSISNQAQAGSNEHQTITQQNDESPNTDGACARAEQLKKLFVHAEMECKNTQGYIEKGNQCKMNRANCVKEYGASQCGKCGEYIPDMPF